MADLKKFRWLGPGVVHVLENGEKKVIGPGSLVEKAEHLASLGAERIEHFVKIGVAVLVNDLREFFKPDAAKPVGEATPEELAIAEKSASDADTSHDAALALAQNADAALAAQGKPSLAQTQKDEPEGGEKKGGILSSLFGGNKDNKDNKDEPDTTGAGPK